MTKSITKLVKVIGMGALLTGAVATGASQANETPDGVVVRIAELEIDPARVGEFKAIVAEEMDEAIKLEPGVVAIYAVAEKGAPNRLKFFEIYRSEDAYRAHRETPHFQKYLKLTQPMILSRKLIEADPVKLVQKSAW